MAMIRSLKAPDRFADLAELVLATILKQAGEATRIDSVADPYLQVSIKNAERERRGKVGFVVQIAHSSYALDNGRNSFPMIFFLFIWTYCNEFCSPKRSRRLAARQVGGPKRGRTNRNAAADAPVRETDITPREDRTPQFGGRKRARTRITQTNDSDVPDIQSNNTPQEKDSSNAQDEIHQTPQSQVQIPESVIQEVVQRVTAELSKQLLPCPSTSAQHQVAHNSRPSEVSVEEAIAAARAAHTGQPAMQGTGPAAMPGNLFSSPSLPVDGRVSDKLKAKIWQNEFVEFGLLLANPILEGKYQLTLSASQNGSMPALNVEPVSKTKKYLSIENWLSYFHIFVGVGETHSGPCQPGT
ncbi:uncharacterized protein LOC116611648 [Nematostella vectensis]|uniref:uncharacterized protein LOC116611648 n=1 Tax=Nematostella vectensis TaxID=45351 RepID=UPI00138FF93A|nr:uncharacterized protein LOC116611648 [Nematostella vectensis]